MTEAEKAYQYFVIAVPENEEQAKAYFWARKALQSTLTPPNEWVNRVRELDELYTKLQIVTGFTAEQLLEIFAAGYTLEKPDYSKKFAEMENLAEAAQPNDPLTIEQLREMDGEPVWGKSLITEKPGEWFILRVVEMSKTWFIACAGAEQGFGDKDTYGKTWLAYRRQPEGEA